MDADPFIILAVLSSILLAMGGGAWVDRRIRQGPRGSGEDGDPGRATRELLKRVRRIEIASRRTVNNQLAGSYHSVFKGRGMAFADVRPYAPGDEIRFIDWNVTARTGELHVKQFTEERELTVFICVDVSRSLEFGTRGREKRELAAEIAALLAMSAMRNQDKVGLITFSDRVETFIPPRKGRGQVLRVIREVLTARAKGSRTDLETVLRHISQAIRKQAVVFLISDFSGVLGGRINSPAERALRTAGRRHDLICMEVTDPLEEALPDAGVVEMVDVETGEKKLVDTSSAHIRRVFKARMLEERTARVDRLKRLGLDHLVLTTGHDNQAPIVRFFASRARRASKG